MKSPSVIRRDPIMDRWVVFAEGRSQRPSDFDSKSKPQRNNNECPFCPGRESETPPEIVADRNEGSAPNTPGWSLRVFENRYPAFGGDAPGSEMQPSGLFQQVTGIGRQEVIVETPDHNACFRNYPQDRMERILYYYRERLIAAYEDPRVRHVQIFRNDGPGGGASLLHPHSQLMAGPVVPVSLVEEAEREAEYRRTHGIGLLQAVMDSELAEGARVIEAGDGLVTFAPFASRCTYEVWIAPAKMERGFSLITDEEIGVLAGALKRAVTALAKVIDDAPFNIVLHAPPGEPGNRAFPWRIEILPRLGLVGGFELGTECYVNSELPETVTAKLRLAGQEAEGTGNP